MSDVVGNYNVPYLTFLAIISYFNSENSLHLIKLFSVLFDVVLAIGSAQLVSLVNEKKVPQLAAFFGVLFIPTVIINSSFWGQCDSIYASFCILSLYFALSKKPWASIVMIAIAFSFKLQTVFIMPVFLLLWGCGYFKWYHFTAFPVVYLLMMLPSIVAGMPFVDAMLLYSTQLGDAVGKYSNNGPSLWLLVQCAPTTLPRLNRGNIVPIVCKIATVLALVVTLIILAFQIIRRKQLERTDIILTAAAIVLIIPFLLPHMHERYFFLADIFSLILTCINLKYTPVFILTESASLWCYWCLYKYDPVNYLGYLGSIAIFTAIVVLIAIYTLDLVKRNSKTINN